MIKNIHQYSFFFFWSFFVVLNTVGKGNIKEKKKESGGAGANILRKKRQFLCVLAEKDDVA
jgi:hypothetical protein